jgi:hypothetical protein
MPSGTPFAPQVDRAWDNRGFKGNEARLWT